MNEEKKFTESDDSFSVSTFEEEDDDILNAKIGDYSENGVNGVNELEEEKN